MVLLMILYWESILKNYVPVFVDKREVICEIKHSLFNCFIARFGCRRCTPNLTMATLAYWDAGSWKKKGMRPSPFGLDS